MDDDDKVDDDDDDDDDDKYKDADDGNVSASAI